MKASSSEYDMKRKKKKREKKRERERERESVTTGLESAKLTRECDQVCDWAERADPRICAALVRAAPLLFTGPR